MDDEGSPPPTKLALQLHQTPKILFVFDEATGDFVESHPTISFPSPIVPPSQGTKPDTMKKRKKNTKGKDKKAETTAPHKQSQDDDDDAPMVEKPVTMKLKSNDHKVANDKVIHAMLTVRTWGPGPSKPPAVTLGVGGGGFGEKVPSSAKAIKNGLKSIGILEVMEEDFGDFMQVDSHYWNKEVTPFVGSYKSQEEHSDTCD